MGSLGAGSTVDYFFNGLLGVAETKNGGRPVGKPAPDGERLGAEECATADAAAPS